MRGGARGVAEHDAARSVRAVARRVRWPEDGYDWNTQRGRQVQRARIAADEYARPPRERYQLRDGAVHDFGSHGFARAAGGLRCLREFLLAWSVVENCTQSQTRQFPSDLAVTLGGPTLRSPACAGIEDGEIADILFCEALADSRVGRRIAREFRARRCHLYWRSGLGRRDRFGDGEILLDDVQTARKRLTRVPQARRRFARLGCAIDHVRPRPSCQKRRAHGSLQIDGDVVMCGADIVPCPCDILRSVEREK